MTTLAASIDTLEQIRQVVAQLTEVDLSGHRPEQPLQLDSISRISLIAELENLFSIELGEDDVSPEMFESLATLTAKVRNKRS